MDGVFDKIRHSGSINSIIRAIVDKHAWYNNFNNAKNKRKQRMYTQRKFAL